MNFKHHEDKIEIFLWLQNGQTKAEVVLGWLHGGSSFTSALHCVWLRPFYIQKLLHLQQRGALPDCSGIYSGHMWESCRMVRDHCMHVEPKYPEFYRDIKKCYWNAVWFYFGKTAAELKCLVSRVIAGHEMTHTLQFFFLYQLVPTPVPDL